MVTKIYNIPFLGNGSAFWAFLDAYATSLDVDPICGKPALHRAPDALWEDFVRVAADANYALSKRAKI